MKIRQNSYGLLLGLLLFLAAPVPFAADYEIRLTEKVIASAEVKYGHDARRRLAAWLNLLKGSRDKSEAEKLKLANAFFNRVSYMPDMENWGRPQYWATPVEMLASNGATAEDYAIGKYFTLLALGVNIDQLHIVYVKSTRLPPENQAHMVLAYYSSPSSMPLILDNLDSDIKPGSERDDLTPVYSFNGNGLWLARERSAGRTAAADNANLWNEMNARMGKEFDEPELKSNSPRKAP
ncbi:MAG: transglutaminase-like cysteine peptidase [Gallionellaceae bacterium]|nr:transglutaminase-like cysteine peptidase [Gallionellaceae bacterium]